MVLPSLRGQKNRYTVMQTDDGVLHWCVIDPETKALIELPLGPPNPYENYHE